LVNRALPDAQLDDFVITLRVELPASKTSLELAKKLVNARAGIPAEASAGRQASRLLPPPLGLKLEH